MHTNDPLIKTIWIFLLSQAVSFTRYQLCIKNWSQPITYPTLTHQIFLCYILDYFVHNTSGYVISLSNWTSLNCERKSLSNKRKKTFYVSLKDSHNHKLHGDNQMHACNHTHMHAHIHTDINRVEREQRKLQTRSADTVTALVLLTM